MKNKKLLWSVLVLAVVAITVAAILFWPGAKFPAQTTLCGLNVSELSPEEAGQMLQNTISEYTLQLTIDGQSYTLTREDLGLRCTVEDLTPLVDNLPASSWDLMAMDDTAITDFLEANMEECRVAAVPPSPDFDPATGKFVVNYGIPETWHSREVAAQLITEAIAQLKPQLELTSEMLLQKRTDPDHLATAVSMVEQANALLAEGVTLEGLHIGAEEPQTLTLSDEDYASMLRFDVTTGETSVDEAAAQEILTELCAPYAIAAGQGNFISNRGYEVSIEVPLAARMVDVQDLYQQILNHVRNNLSEPLTVNYTTSNGHGNPNFDGNYIEVSIPDQLLWVYQNGEVVIETGIVTGNYRVGNYSPTGLRKIWSHREKVFLITDEYFSEYWMAIVPDERYGLHDADNWREIEEYGGDTYLNHGSGGCINIPRDVIREIYAIVPDGTPVVLYDHRHVSPEIGYDIIITYYKPTPITLDAAEKYPGAEITYTVSNSRLGYVNDNGQFVMQNCGGSYVTAEVKPADGSDPVTLTYFIWVRVG